MVHLDANEEEDYGYRETEKDASEKTGIHCVWCLDAIQRVPGAGKGSCSAFEFGNKVAGIRQKTDELAQSCTS